VGPSSSAWWHGTITLRDNPEGSKPGVIPRCSTDPHISASKPWWYSPAVGRKHATGSTIAPLLLKHKHTSAHVPVTSVADFKLSDKEILRQCNEDYAIPSKTAMVTVRSTASDGGLRTQYSFCVACTRGAEKQRHHGQVTKTAK
jgi:hypothetical protein